jgi:hypothetical protein
MPTDAWRFLLQDQEFLHLHGVDEYLQRPEVRNRLKAISSFSQVFDRSFTFSPPNQDLCKIGSATPLLKRGIVLPSQLLVAQSLSSTRVKFSLETCERICEVFPDLRPAVIAYAARLKIPYSPIEPLPDIHSIAASFTLKKGCMRAACAKSADTDPFVFDRFRMFLFEHVGAVEKESCWFYLLRCLRIGATTGSRHMDIRRDTADKFHLIRAHFAAQSDYVVREMRVLVQLLYSTEEVERVFVQFPQLRPCATFANFEIPSYFIDLLRQCHSAVLPELLRHLEQNRAKLLRTPIVAEAIITLLVNNRSLITQPDGYLTAFLAPDFLLFKMAEPLFPALIARSTGLATFRASFEGLSERCLCLPCALSVISTFFGVFLKGTKNAGVREFEVVERGFRNGLTVDSAKQFAEELKLATSLCDLSMLVQKYVMQPDNCFVVVFLVLKWLLVGWKDAEKRAFLNLVMRRSAESPYKSRQKAIDGLAANATDKAFILALAETSDDAVMRAIVADIVDPGRSAERKADGVSPPRDFPPARPRSVALRFAVNPV